jgi:heterokaryon incompatibility protein (HET)
VNRNIVEPYLTLSYCWGGSQISELRKKRLAEYMSILPMGQLPQTILDAFYATKRLGFRYIWIDSLCIIQDDIDDKLQEISNMATIYKESILTISAATAKRVEEGFLGPRDDIFATLGRVPFLCKNGTLGTVGISGSVISISYDSNENPIEQRAWTYQERLLASRVLIYSNIGLRFVCRSEIHASIAGSSWIERNLSPRYVDFNRQDPQLWKDVITEYSKRVMSDPGDKLLAIAGLAKSHAAARGKRRDKYLAGLWRESIATDLLWESAYERLSKCATNHHAPSWSWASTDSEFTYPIVSKAVSQSIIRDFKLIGEKIVPRASHDLYGQLESGQLEVRGRFCQISKGRLDELGWGIQKPEEVLNLSSTWRPFVLKPNPRIQDGLQRRIDGNTWVDDPVNYSTFRMSFDSDDAGQKDIFLLLILTNVAQREKAGLLKICCGLILERTDETATRRKFKRAGIFEFKLSKAQRRDQSEGAMPQHQPSQPLRDYSCLWRILEAPEEDLVLI